MQQTFDVLVSIQRMPDPTTSIFKGIVITQLCIRVFCADDVRHCGGYCAIEVFRWNDATENAKIIAKSRY
jgi:hypothetical protein